MVFDVFDIRLKCDLICARCLCIMTRLPQDEIPAEFCITL